MTDFQENIKEKIVIIGPVYPFKGGISHYTGCLVRSLEKNFDVETISFKIQYPKFLFKKQQKDYSNESFKIENAKFWINTVNPFNWIIVAIKIAIIKPKFVLFEWWHPYFSPCFFVISLLLRFFCSVIFLCHNVLPHKRFPLDTYLTKLVLKNGKGFIVHSEADSVELRSILRSPSYVVSPHPTYNIFNFNKLTYEKARSLLNVDINDNLILFFGFVRKYKGLNYLLEAFSIAIDNDTKLKLFVVGDFDQDKSDYLKIVNNLNLNNHITIVDGYIPDKDVEKYFAACDVVVLPYISATQSGIVQIAYDFKKPVIATKVGGLPDVVLEGKTGFLVPPENSKELAKSISYFFDNKNVIDFGTNIDSINYKFDWMRMNEAVIKLKGML